MTKTNKEILNLATNSIGHIDEKKLFDLLYPSCKRKRTVSDLGLSAQSNIPCKPGAVIMAGIKQLISNIELLKDSDRLLYYIARLQLVGGLRISEVLSISVYDITIAGHVNIKSKKGSQLCTIYGDVAADYLVQCKVNGVSPFSAYSRFYVYRQYLKRGIVFHSENSSKSSVTHALRHASAKAMRLAKIDNKEIQKFLRHKSPKSTEYYG